MSALAGIRIAEVSDGWTAAALAGRLLAELGAQVTKLERPEGDPLRRRGPFTPGGISHAFQIAAAQKGSILLQPDKEREALSALALESDVLLVDRERWRELHSHEITQERLLEANPGLILCVISPFGLSGPLSHWVGSELVLQAFAGLMATTGFPGDPPTSSGVPMVTCATAVFATIAILATLYERRRSGLGQVVDVAEYDVAVSYMGNFLPAYFRFGGSPRGVGNRHPLIAPWNAYAARDGWVLICMTGDSQWARLVEAIGLPELREEKFRTNDLRVQNVDELDSRISRWVGQRAVEEVAEAVNAVKLASGPVVPVHQLFTQHYFVDRRMLVEVPHPVAGEVPTLGTLFKMSATPGRVDRCAPELGQYAWTLAESLAEVPRPRPAGAGGPSSSSKPLEGVRVVEVATHTAVPYGLRLLAMLGAEVIKVEPLQGEAMRRLAISLSEKTGDAYLFHLYNTDKKSITLDLASPRGKEIFLELIRGAHVFVENLSQEFIASLGIDYASLKKVNPNLIYCAVSGFGLEGPWRYRRAMDTVIQALTGITDLTGFPERPPVKVGISLVDLLGSCVAAAAILAALYHRARTGQGQLLDVAMCDVGAWLTAEVWPLVLAGEKVSRVGNRHRFHAPYNAYRARDRWVVVSVEMDRQWQALLEAMGRQDLVGDARYATEADRVERWEALDRLVADWVALREAAEVVLLCQEAGVPAGPVQEVAEVAEHAHTRVREIIVRRSGHWLLGSPIKLSRTPVTVGSLAPAVGQHNAEVLGGLLGLSSDQREEMKARGVV